MRITFHFQQLNKPDFFQPALLRVWLKTLAKTYDINPGELTYIFVTDEALLKMNVEYLHHDTYTDIITFNNSDSDKTEGDIFISLERVADNSGKFKSTFEKELVRVMAHGLLHLTGFNDKTSKEKKAMRAAEEKGIKLYQSLKKNRETIKSSHGQ